MQSKVFFLGDIFSNFLLTSAFCHPHPPTHLFPDVILEWSLGVFWNRHVHCDVCTYVKNVFMVHDEKKVHLNFSKSLWIFNHDGTNTKNQGICTTFTYFFSTCTNKLHHFDTTTIARSSVRHSIFVCIGSHNWKDHGIEDCQMIGFKTLYLTYSCFYSFFSLQ